MSHPEQEFKAAIAAAGICPPDHIAGDGAIHRFSTTGKRGDDSGWYVLHLDGVPAGVFGCWRSGMQVSWCARSDAAMTPAEREAHRQRIKAMQAQREADEAERHQAAAAEAARRWEAASPCSDHPYLAAKGVKPHGVRVAGDGALLIPMRDAEGKLWNVERVNPNDTKDKRGLPGGRRTGLYHSIGKPDGTLIVCEGYATGASLHECTGKAVAVAFNAGNLEPVARALRAKYPAARVILAADDDHRREGNPGVSKATGAAQAVNAVLAVPDFGECRPDNATDFNDLHQISGAHAVRRCIEAAAGAVQQPASQDGVILTCAASLRPEPVAWLWPEWLALGKLHILAGAPGQGKTTIALALMATVTIGGRWPDGSRCPAGNVLMWSGEDDPADTLLPRLLAMGADPTRVYFVTGARVGGEVMPFDPARDMAQLKAQAERIGDVRLLAVDPVVSAVAGDSHKNTEVRRALQPLVDLGAALGAAVLGISHFSKGSSGRDPTERVVGSMAFGAVARVVLCAAKVKGKDGGDDRRILVRSKSNIGPDEGGFEYGIEQIELDAHPGVQASLIQWGRTVDGTARELLAEAEADSSDEAISARDADESLRELLKGAERMDSRTVIECLKAEGFSDKQIRSARERIGAKVERSGFGAAMRSYWKLPQSCPVVPSRARHNLGQEWASMGMTDSAEAEGEVF